MKRIDTIPDPLLSLRDLRVVLALARTGATSRAAEVLHLTQPAVSRALLGIEDRLATQLFERLPRGLRPTPSGARLAEEAARLLGSVLEVESALRAPSRGLSRVRLVCQCYTAYHWLPSALVRLRDTMPELRVSLAVEHTDAPIEALVAGDIDVALLTSPALPAGVASLPLFADEVVFVLAASHPLARKKRIAPEDLLLYPILTARIPDDEASWFLSRVFGRRRPRLSLLRVPLTEAILDLARAGMGIAVLSEWVVSPHLGRGDLVIRRLSSGPLHRPWSLAYRLEAHEVAVRLAALLASAPPVLSPQA
jgi:LysR family transcriptional regulator for metE and metH